MSMYNAACAIPASISQECFLLLQDHEVKEPYFLYGSLAAQPLLPPGGREVFVLKKLLPQTVDFDFNVHVMDFKPGEYLHIKVRPLLCGCGWGCIQTRG